MKKILKKILRYVKNRFELYKMSYSRKNQIKKFKDPRRVAIWSKVELTDEQKQAIDSFYLENYGEKIPHIWHRHFTAFTGKFDVKYFPELLFIPEFERFMTLHREYAQVFTDKNMLPMLAASAGVKTVKSYVTSTKGAIRDETCRFIAHEHAIEKLKNIGDVFIKPTVDSNSGRGCFVANFQDGVDVISGKTIQKILSSLGRDYAVQERLVCHESISTIYSGSVNTFRVITYRWRDQILMLPVIMRIGSGGAYLDNAHAGGMFIALDNDGTMHKTAFTEFKQEFTEHPDSHLQFEGYRIELLPRVIEAAKALHETLPQIGCVNWDFTIDTDGNPTLIEANMANGKQGGSIWLVEMAHGCGAFGDNTAEVLRWLRWMKKQPRSKWEKYEFGYFEEDNK